MIRRSLGGGGLGATPSASVAPSRQGRGTGGNALSKREWQSLSVLPVQKLVTAVDRVRTQVEATRQHRDSEIKGQQAFSSSCIVGTVAVRDHAATAVNDVGGNCCCYVPIAAADAGGNVVHASHPRCDWSHDRVRATYRPCQRNNRNPVQVQTDKPNNVAMLNTMLR